MTLLRSRPLLALAGLLAGAGAGPLGCGNDANTTTGGGATTSTGGSGAGGSTGTAGSAAGGSTGTAGSGTGGSTGTAGSGTGGATGGSTGTAGSGTGGATGGSTGTAGAGTGGATGGSTGTAGSGGGAAFCGNGVIEAPEQCDWGASNAPGAGCEADCTFSCIMAPDSCPDAEACNGVEACVTVTTPDGTGQKCMTGMQALDCTACPGGLCHSGACMSSTCGDGCVDAGAGEQCELPGTPICSDTCQTIVLVPCGNGVRDAGEQCDDGNTTNLDGCDAACSFEQDLRTNVLQMQFGTDAYCTSNRLGAAFAPAAQSSVLQAMSLSINNGTGGFLVKLLDLASPAGADDPSLQIGTLRGTPAPGVGYSGAADLDWWYTPSPVTIDLARNPIEGMPGSLLGSVLQGGPGTVTFPLTLIGTTHSLFHLSNAKLTAPLTALPLAPTPSNGGVPPGHLPSEHLDPALTSFPSAGQAVASFYGKLCGNTGVKAFADTPIESSLLPGGAVACNEGYTAASSLLDVLVGGCTVTIGGPLPVIFPSQPDTFDPAAPAGGAGAPYTLVANAQKIVTTCTDKNGASVPLATCIDAAAYSSFFRFVMGRVIVK